MSKIIEINAETGEFVERDLTKEELSQKELDEIMFKEQENILQKNIDARASALAKIAEIAGLTEEEVNAL